MEDFEDGFPLPYWRVVKPRYNRRAPWHDYKSRCIYLITIGKSPSIPDFSSLARPDSKNTSPYVILSSIGQILDDALREMCSKYPELRITEKVIMPDHIHFVLNATQDLDYHIGKAIGFFKGRCSRVYTDWTCPQEELKVINIFEDGYNDRILMRSGQLNKMLNYVRDNPRRLWIKRMHPDLFTIRHSITIDGERFIALGNIFLLRNPHIEQVRVSSKYTPEELQENVEKWLRAIEAGGALVSPFISRQEKGYRDKAIESGANLIIIEENGLPDRYKPGGQYFDLCAAGRLLIIAQEKYHSQTAPLTRTKALYMNDLAAFIAAGSFASLSLNLS